MELVGLLLPVSRAHGHFYDFRSAQSPCSSLNVFRKPERFHLVLKLKQIVDSNLAVRPAAHQIRTLSHVHPNVKVVHQSVPLSRRSSTPMLHDLSHENQTIRNFWRQLVNSLLSQINWNSTRRSLILFFIWSFADWPAPDVLIASQPDQTDSWIGTTNATQVISDCPKFWFDFTKHGHITWRDVLVGLVH